MIQDFDKWVAERWANQAIHDAYRPHNTQPYPMVAALGLAGEVGEVMELLKKHYRDGEHPGDALKLEIGDVLHYLTKITHSYGWTLADVMAANIAKLEARDAEARK